MVKTTVDLGRVRANATTIKAATNVGLIGVVKADAYGLGAVSVADAIADLVDAWYVFRPIEATQARLFEITGKRTIAAVVEPDDNLDMLQTQGIRPAVWTLEQTRRFAKLDPLLCVDTGMQRFCCPAADLPELLDAHPFTEAFTHAARPDQAARLRQLVGDRVPRLHAAGTALLSNPDCRLDAVRPGIALFEGAVSVTARLVDARNSLGPLGYGGIKSPTGRHGVILRGYSDGLRKGPCVVNGERQQLIEVGMQSAYVSIGTRDRIGDEVILLGDGLTKAEIGQAWNASAHEVLVTLAAMGERQYRSA